MHRSIFILALTVVVLCCSCRADASEEQNHGIKRQIHGSSEFTFRNERLMHELTKLGENWIEVFYDGTSRIFVRIGVFKDGVPILTSERFTGHSSAIVSQLSMPGDIYPRRICVGSEIYNRTADGFFEIMADPSATAKESVLMGVEFSSKEINRLREAFLKPSEDK